MIDDVATACMRLAASMRYLGLMPKSTRVLATITVPSMALKSMATDARFRETNPRPDAIVDFSEMFVQVSNGYQVRLVAEVES